jgi:ABC-type sugar transport system, periplasmic component
MKKNGVTKSLVRRVAAGLMALMLLMPLLAACSKGESTESAERRVLRIGVLYGGSDNEQYFRQQYTDTFEFTHPNIDLEIAYAINYDDMRYTQPGQEQEQKDPYEEFKKLLTGQNPVDVVVLDYNMLKRLTQDNLLKQLDPLIQQDEFDLSDYVPTVIDGIKEAGEGNIYALTPTFSSSALFYNKEIFQKAGVEPPTDNMMWEDVINKAREVSKGEGKERTFGLMLSRWSYQGFWDMQNYASPLQLKIFDDKGERMTVNTEGWAKVWETIVKLYKDKLTPTQEDLNALMEEMNKSGDSYGYRPYSDDFFMNGRVAMVIADYGYINDLIRAKDMSATNKDIKAIDWDVVTVPQHPEKPGVGGNVYLSQLMGVNANAQNPDDAWEFVKFSNSREWAKLKSRSTYEMVARKEFLQPKGGLDYNIQAFYSLKPLPPQSLEQEKLYREIPGIWEAQQPGEQLFNEVLQGNKTIKEALAEWETKGNEVLQRLKQNKSNNGKDTQSSGVEVLPVPETKAEEAEEAKTE